MGKYTRRKTLTPAASDKKILKMWARRAQKWCDAVYEQVERGALDILKSAPRNNDVTK